MNIIISSTILEGITANVKEIIFRGIVRIAIP